MWKTTSLLLVLASALAGTASAEEPIAAAAETTAAVEPAPAAATAETPECAAQPPDWQAASDLDLAERRGGMSFVDQANAATVAGNRVGDGVMTGNISLGEAAISNVSGVFAGTFNSGNNVSIQTNLNVTIHLD